MPTNNGLHVAKKGKLSIDKCSINVAMLSNGVRVVCRPTPKEGLVNNEAFILNRDMNSVLSNLPLYIETFKDHLPQIKQYLAGDADKIGLLRFRDGELQATGYDALILADAAETYLQYRDALKEKSEPIPEKYSDVIRFSEILMVKLAYIGMMALVDEATEYQEIRDDGELVNILRNDI